MKLDFLYRSRLAKNALLGSILGATCLSASAVSFDCTKARSKSERLICGDPQLSALDDRLAALAAAGKKRAANPRAYQRALDDAWSVRQKCDTIACVESWYARRIEALADGQPTRNALVPPAAPVAKAEPPVAAAPAVERRQPEPAPKVAAAARPAPVIEEPVKQNVIPGAQLQVIGSELGFHIPLTREQFLERYAASGGQCGVSKHQPSLKALSRSVESDCWTGAECRAPGGGFSCKILRTGYDGTGRIVLFSTTLGSADGKDAQGTADMGKLVNKFAEFGGGEVSTRDVRHGKVMSASSIQGQFRLEAEVTSSEEGKQVGTFSVASK